MYIGNNQVIEAYADYGITIQSLDNYFDYNNLQILRVNVSPQLKEKAISYALQQQNKLFFPLAFKNDERYWNCSKIIWKAYYESGIDLDAINDLWIAPEAFCDSSHVEVIF